MIVVADASPLIALARIERLGLLREMFGKLLLPDAVWIEVAEERMGRPGAELVPRADWIERKSVADRALVSLLRRDLGAGESEAIALAREVAGSVPLLDERLGRAAAKRMGLRVTGWWGFSSPKENAACSLIPKEWSRISR